MLTKKTCLWPFISKQLNQPPWFAIAISQPQGCLGVGATKIG